MNAPTSFTSFHAANTSLLTISLSLRPCSPLGTYSLLPDGVQDFPTSCGGLSREDAAANPSCDGMTDSLAILQSKLQPQTPRAFAAASPRASPFPPDLLLTQRSAPRTQPPW